MKKICVLTPLFLPVPAVKGGAIENLITILINENENNNGMFFDIYTMHDEEIKNNYKNSNIIQIKLSNITIFFQKCLNKFFNVFKINKYYYFNTLKYKKILRNINKNKYDAIVVENNMQLYKYIFSNIKNKSIPFYFHLHNDLNIENKSDEDYKFILNTSKNIILVSDFLKNKLEIYGQKNKLETLHNVIDRKYFSDFKYDKKTIDELKDKFDLRDKLVFGYIGRPDKEKGILELIQAFNKIKNNNVRLLLVSDDFTKVKYKKTFLNQITHEYEKNINKIKISGRISYDLMPLYYNLIDIVVIPTICEEAFGMVALEAKTLNKKIIYTDSGALSEVLKGTNAKKVELNENVVDNLYKALSNSIENFENKEQKKYNYQNNDLKEYYDNFINIISK